jgi:hypothetical protein
MNSRFHDAGKSPVNNSETLTALLYSAFKFSSFRPNQEAVCRAAIEGRDVLLVMPDRIREIFVLPVAWYRPEWDHACNQSLDCTHG